MAFLVALLLLMSSNLFALGSACSCHQVPYCQSTTNADVLVRARVLYENLDTQAHWFGNSPQSNTRVYIVRAIQVFKSPSNIRLPLHFAVRTPASSASCGVKLEIGKQYALILKMGQGGLHTHLCSQNLKWADVTSEQKAVLRRAGSCCSCSEFQECRIFQRTGEHYCADVCRRGRCPRGSQCELQQVTCVRAPCPPIAKCTPNLQQDDTCHPGRCPKGTRCELKQVACVTTPCPPIVECVPIHQRDCPDSCIEIYQPVCGTDGKTYGNLCLLKQAACKKKSRPKLTLQHEGACVCEEPCAPSNRPVCGVRVDSRPVQYSTFRNRCEFRNARKCSGHKWRFYSRGTCPN